MFQIGDSHVHQLRDGQVKTLTEAGRGRQLDDFLGMGPGVAEVIRTTSEPVRPGDVYVLVTDGVSVGVEPDAFSEIWSSSRGDPAACAAAIIGAVARCRGDDDATALVVLVLD